MIFRSKKRKFSPVPGLGNKVLNDICYWWYYNRKIVTIRVNNMKSIILLICGVLVSSMLYANNNGEDEWIYDIYVTLNDPSKEDKLSGTVTYVVDEVEYKAEFFEKKVYFKFDSIPNKRGIIKLESEGFDSQEYPFTLGRNISQHFYLGLKGKSSYTLRFGVMYPFYGEPDQYWVTVGDPNKAADLYRYLDSLNLLYDGWDNNTEYIKSVVSKNQYNAKGFTSSLIPLNEITPSEISKVRKEILGHENATEVGILVGNTYLHGIFTGEIHVDFLGAISDKNVAEVCEKYDMAILKKLNDSEFILTMNDKAKIKSNEAAIMLLNEYDVYINAKIWQFFPNENLGH